MGTKFFRSLIAGWSVMLSFSTITLAGDYVHRVIIANEGFYDYYGGMAQVQPAHLAAYDPVTGAYSVFDTIEGARFTTEVLVNEHYIVAAADTFLIKYDRNSLQRLAIQTVKGIRGIAVWNDKVLVTRGEVGGLPSYFQVYNISDLSFDYELDAANGPQYAAQDIRIVNDKAYFVINNGFEWPPNPKGLIGIVDLNTRAYTEVDLGPDGLNPDNLMLDGDKLYTLNNKDFTGSSVSVYNILTGGVTTANLANVTTGCGTSTLFASNIWYQHYASAKMYAFDPQLLQISDSASVNKQFYGMDVDPVNNYLYASVTVTDSDFIPVSSMAYIYDANQVLLDSFGVGFFAGSMAFDVRKTTGILNDVHQDMISVFPNPSTDELRVDFKGLEAEKLEVIDMSGKQVSTRAVAGVPVISLNTEALSAGMYHLVITGRDGVRTMTKFIKQ